MRTLVDTQKIWSMQNWRQSTGVRLKWTEDGGKDLYVAEVPNEVYSAADFSLDNAQGVLVPRAYYTLPYKPGWTVFEGDLEENHFLKTVPFYIYDADEPVEDWPTSETREEIDIYEKLRLHPHPNIVKFYGVEVRDGEVLGIVLERIDAPITQALSSPRKPSHILDLDIAMKQLDSAVDHLHSIDIVHCDIAPSNIGLGADGRLLLFDFDSAFPVGARRHGKMSNGTWDNPPEVLAADFACKEVDYESVKLTRERLLGCRRRFKVVPAPKA